jgi:hypothetical protein
VCCSYISNSNKLGQMEILPYKIQVLSILFSLAFMYFIFRLIVKGKLREEYSVIWIVLTLILILLSIFRTTLDEIAGFLGVFYSPSLLFLLGFMAVVSFLVHLSIVNSRQHNQIKNLTQEISLLKFKIEKESGK